LIYVLGFTNALSQVRIISEDNDSDIMNFGPVLLGNYSDIKITIQNSSPEELAINDVLPSYYLGIFPNTPNNHYVEFDLISHKLPITIEKNSTIVLTFRYAAKSDITNYPLGYKKALLKIGLFPKKLNRNPAQSDLVAYREFSLFSKKTDLLLSAFQDSLKIDSICVKPLDTLEYKWKIYNLTPKAIKLRDEKFTYLNNNCFDFEIKAEKEGMNQGAFNNQYDYAIRKFKYYPVNRGWDTAHYALFYPSDPLNANSKSDSTVFKLFAFGVEQRLKVNSVIEGDSYKDTIDIGDIRLGNKKTFKIIIKNIGNLPFGAIGQSILKEYLDDNESAFVFNRYFISNGKHLPIDALDTIEMTFTPLESRTYISRLVINSDIGARNIYGVNNESRKVTFYIKARAVEPKIAAAQEIVDLGEVVVSESCPSGKDSVATIYNLGNQTLRIFSAEIYPLSGSPYSLDFNETAVEPNKFAKIKFTFHSENLSTGVAYPRKIRLRTNCDPPNDVFDIPITAKAIGLYPITVNIPKNLKSKSGATVKVPILVDKSKMSSASKFISTLTYDPNMLEFDSYNKISTCSENTNSIDISEIENGKLSIKINIENGYFIPKDTLISLRFRTFLSDNISTPIAFEDVKIGNSNCEKIFNINNLAEANGVFQIDSICGISYKTKKPLSGKIKFTEVYPNPASEKAYIEYEITDNTYLNLAIYDDLGQMIENLVSGIVDKGTYKLIIDVSKYKIGAYFCKAFLGNNVKILKFNVY
jgi:hypothetical protein